MKMKRFGCVLTAAVMGMQLSAYMPVTAVTEPAVCQTGARALSAFADGIRDVTKNDADKQFYETVTFDAENGVLSADGSAQSGCGDLTVRNGELMICSASPEQHVQSAGTIRRFADAASDFGYETAQDGDTLTITNEFQTARLIVKAAGDIDAHGAQSVTSGYRDLHILQYATTAQAYAAYQAYQDDPAVQYVQPSHIVSLDPDELASADAGTVSGLDSHSYMTWGADLIGTEDFYKQYLADKDLPEVRIAVIDTGINEAPALFKDRILPDGVNYSSSGNDSVADDLNHGTHVTGTICELTPSNVKILPIKSFDRKGHATDEQIYAGIMYALENDADVLNMSFGGLGVNPLEVEAMMIAEKNGIICCAAAGNNADDARYYYPSSIKSCITVAAVNNAMTRAEFSNFGDMIDVSAPGVGIVSYGIENAERLESKDGTSMATPHVSACCALLRSYDKEMSADRAERLLCLNATDLGADGFDKNTGWGLVCMKNFRWDAGICKAPEFSEDPGNYGTAQTVELTAEDASMQIYYTTDGTVPSAENGTLYTEPLEITASARILAVAVKEGYVNSAPAEAIYTIGGKDIADAWTIRDGVVLSYKGVRREVRVPESADDVPVTAIAAHAFAGNHCVETVVLPECITEIGEEAFAGCASLKELTASGAEQIGAGAFANDAALEKLTFGEKTAQIGAGAFRSCPALETLALNAAEMIPDQCFAGCSSLKKLTLPAAKTIGEAACQDCGALETVQINWRQVTAVGTRAFSGCGALTADLYLEQLAELGEYAFENDRSLLRIALPESIRVIPEGAFSGCSGLRRLELPGAEEFRNEAAAIGSAREDFVAILPYDRITDLGTNALDGVRLGNGFDTVTFSALEQIGFRSFAGVTAGVLNLPKIKKIPRGAFASANLYGLRAEAAETLESGSLSGVRAAQLSDAVKELAADAVPAETWIVTAADTVLPETGAVQKLCQEPLVMRVNQRTLTAAQHESAEFRITALGVGLHYQWYRMEDAEPAEIPDTDAPVFAPPTGTVGSFTYRCVIKDAEGKLETVECTAVITEAEAAEKLVPEQLYEIKESGTFRYQLTAPEAGVYQFEAEGSAAVSGTLTDADGTVLGSFPAETSDLQAFRVQLAAGQVCLLTVTPCWEGMISLRVTASPAERSSVSACKVQVLPALFNVYGSDWHPDLVVVAPDGRTLTENYDYIVQVIKRNTHLQIGVIGIGKYQGYCEAEAEIIDRIPADTAIPVTLTGKEDISTMLFIPEKTETYYYYGTVDPRYQQEWEDKQATGSYRNGQLYTGVMAKCVISSQPNGAGTVFAENSYSTFNDNQFCGSVKLNAGQMYYLTCTIREERTVKFSLVVSEQLRDVRKATMDGSFFAVYQDGKYYDPEIELTDGEKELVPGEDFLVLNAQNDAPGTASVTIVGTGLYLGKVTREYEIINPYKKVPETLNPIGETTLMSCEDSHLATFWFRADQAAEGAGEARYRILNEQVSGSALLHRVYRFDEQLKALSLVHPMQDEKNDYLLRNGIYCVTVSRKNTERGGTANLTVVVPYSLQEATITTGETAYTGDEVEAPVTLTMPDGTVLQQKRDYVVAYAEEYLNVMFGEVPFTLRSTKYSYGSGSGSYQIVVKIPEQAEQLTVGAHEAPLTLTDRIAWYQLTAEQDTDYLLASDDVTDIVLRVFSGDAEMLEQVSGTGTKALTFSVPAGETRYIMVKYNGLTREGTLHFRLETDQKALASCEVEAKPVLWTGEHVTPDILLTDGDYALVEGVDYVQRYIVNDVDVGTASVNYIGKGKYVGMLDVDFPIVFDRADFTARTEEMMLMPLMLDYEYTIRNTEEHRYRVFSYYSQLDAMIRLSVFNARCKLSVQIYNCVGEYLGCTDVSQEGDLEWDFHAFMPYYYLFSATDISSSNQYWNMQLTDLTNTDLEIFEDPDTGMFYRIFEDREGAELYRVDPSRSELTYHYYIHYNGKDMTVSYVQAGIFPVLSKSTVIYGTLTDNLIPFLDYYHLLFLPLPFCFKSSGLVGDLNGDSMLTPSDLVLFSAILNEHSLIDLEWIDANADLNGDGFTDMLDLLVMLKQLDEAGYAESTVPVF